jgi:hypothetical protein
MRVEPYPITWPKCYEVPTDGCPPVARSHGLHLSTVLHSVAVRMGWLKELDDIEFMGHLGVAFENYASTLTAHVLRESGSTFDFHPGEFELDGIYMNPDGIECTPDGVLRIHEFKLMWCSAGKTIDTMFYRLSQIKGYCHALGITEAVAHMAFAAGYFKPPFPIFDPKLLIFTERELQENWDMVLRESKNV